MQKIVNVNYQQLSDGSCPWIRGRSEVHIYLFCGEGNMLQHQFTCIENESELHDPETKVKSSCMTHIEIVPQLASKHVAISEPFVWPRVAIIIVPEPQKLIPLICPIRIQASAPGCNEVTSVA